VLRHGRSSHLVQHCPLYGSRKRILRGSDREGLTARCVPAKVSVGIPFYTRKWTGFCTQTALCPCTQVNLKTTGPGTEQRAGNRNFRKYDTTYNRTT